MIPDTGSLNPAERADPTIVSAPEWKRDPVFVKFAADYLSTGGAFIDEDFSEAYQWCWKRLDWEQKADRVKALVIHIHGWDDPNYIPKPRKFLETEWKRAAKARDSPRFKSKQQEQADAWDRA